MKTWIELCTVLLIASVLCELIARLVTMCAQKVVRVLLDPSRISKSERDPYFGREYARPENDEEEF